MQMTVRHFTQRESLQAAANRMLPALRSIGERYCHLNPNSPQSKVRAVGAYTAQSGTFTIYKIAMLPAADSSTYTSTDTDSAWAVVDHKAKTILFGPPEGIQVSVEGKGIGPYIFGQLIRLIRTKDDPSSYRIIEIQFPAKPADADAAAEWEIKSRKATTILENHGFHVSTTTSGLVANAQRFGSLTERWNSDKISFLSTARLASLFNETVQGIEDGAAASKALEEQVQQLQRKIEDHAPIDAEVEVLRERDRTQQETISQLTEEISSLLPLQDQVAVMREEMAQAGGKNPASSHNSASDREQALAPAPPTTGQIHIHHLGPIERISLALIAASLAGILIKVALGH